MRFLHSLRSVGMTAGWGPSIGMTAGGFPSSLSSRPRERSDRAEGSPIRKEECPLLIGVLSDSHGRLERLAEAAEIFSSMGVETLIHCGDITTVEAVETLADFEVHWVFGNCDWNEDPLRAAMIRFGHTCHGVRGELDVVGRRLGFTHGHRYEEFQAMVSSGENDVVFHGHTHVRRDEVEHGTRVICPGALHHAAPPGFVVLTVPELKSEWVDLLD